jgi:hypothetical protein
MKMSDCLLDLQASSDYNTADWSFPEDEMVVLLLIGEGRRACWCHFSLRDGVGALCDLDTVVCLPQCSTIAFEKECNQCYNLFLC